MTALAGDQVLVRDAQTEYEAPAGQLGERLVDRLHRHRVARVDVCDAGGQDQGARARRQEADHGEGVSSHGLGDP